ncbi:21721_t:CDS:2, partial [Racocetra persica]
MKQLVDSGLHPEEDLRQQNTGFDKSDDPEFAAYLRGKGHRPSSDQRKAVKKLDIAFKQLTGGLDLSDFVNLKILNCSGENYFRQDLSFLKGAVNLERLDLSNNEFFGSLIYLKEMDKLKILDIDKTNIDDGL